MDVNSVGGSVLAVGVWVFFSIIVLPAEKGRASVSSLRYRHQPDQNDFPDCKQTVSGLKQSSKKPSDEEAS